MSRRKANKHATRVARFKLRAQVLAVVFATTAVAIVGRGFYLQIMQHQMLATEGEIRHVRRMSVAAHRGPIVDRRGEPLALSSPVDSIWAYPTDLMTEAERLPQLAEALDLDVDTLLRKVNRNLDKQFIYLRRRALPEHVVAADALRLPGVDVVREYKRFYPAGEVAAQLVGLTDIDDRGQEGLELAWNRTLAGKSGAKRVLRDRHGRIIQDVESIAPPRHGEVLRTSIDLRIQYFAYRALKEARERHGAQSGSMVILDVQTGEVLAMVNQPWFNPNLRDVSPGESSRNRAITDIVEPGSSIKPLILAAALDQRIVKLDDIVDTTPGFVQVGAKTIRDHHDLGPISLTRLLARSSNVGITRIAMRMEPEELWAALVNYGFGQLTTVGFPGESAGLLNHFADWRPVSQATIGYGYGLSVTPLQLVRAYAALGNHGVIKPVSLLAIDEPVDGQRILSEASSRAVLKMMEAVVLPGGTGAKASIAGYRVAGKTGTSRKLENGTYSAERHFSVFAGLVPASAPRLAAVVVIDEPTGDNYYGGDVAAPVFSQVMTEALRLLAIKPDDVPGLDQTLTAGNTAAQDSVASR